MEDCVHKKYFTCKHSLASLGQESYKYEIQTMAGIHAFSAPDVKFAVFALNQSTPKAVNLDVSNGN